MKSLRVILCAGAVFLGLGCASNGWQAEEAPVPATTPFDSNQMARNAYLEGFRSGYRAQSSGSTAVEMIGGPYLHAREMGFRAGAAAAQAEQGGEAPPATVVAPGK
jgi:hypothetical protein